MNLIKDPRIDKALGQLLREARDVKRLSQQEVADRLSISKATMCLYESGQRTMTFSTFMRLCEVLEISADSTFSKIRKKTNA